MNDKSFGGYDSFEDWLDATRVSLYEEVKGMTIEERLADLHEKTYPVMKKYGIQISDLTPVKPMKRKRVAVTV
ncbi:MAG: hypothetical protein IJT58_08780 [Synergistaceae bacterium]|nr:hypothetical protein [Synergistaceae bacterium]